jgi:tetratricopeptide (TPR) repeat protein
MKGGFMSRRITVLALVVLVSLAGACAKQEQADPAEEAFSALRSALSEAETPEAKAELVEDYLARFPDTERSGWAAGAIVYYRGVQMEDPERVFDVLSASLERIESPDQRFEVSMELLSLADSVEMPFDVAEVADALEAVRPLTFDEHQWVAETATDFEEWSVADRHAYAASELATPEGFRTDYPDSEFTDEKVAAHAQHRKALSLSYDAWALFNLGDTELAFARFAEADAVGSVSYLGVPNTPLYTFWGRAALAEGDVDRAVALLGTETLFGDGLSDAEPFLREAYVAKNGDDEGFDEFLWATRNELATTVDDFTLLDYEGNEISMAEASAGKVTLLAFWFPT